jgi:uncharacterized protein
VVRIELDRLTRGASGFSHAYEPEEFTLDDERVRLTRPPEISGRVIRQGSSVLLKGRLSAQAEVDCDRCLKPIAVPIAAVFNLQYQTAEDYISSQAAELEAADMTLSVFDGAAIDIDEVVREQVLLTVPTQALCREGCLGLCPDCGADRNLTECDCQSAEIDPRWMALSELVNGE